MTADRYSGSVTVGWSMPTSEPGSETVPNFWLSMFSAKMSTFRPSTVLVPERCRLRLQQRGVEYLVGLLLGADRPDESLARHLGRLVPISAPQQLTRRPERRSKARRSVE